MGVRGKRTERVAYRDMRLAPFCRLLFWAARVPNQGTSVNVRTDVCSTKLASTAADETSVLSSRLATLLGPDYETRINDNVARWDKLGIIAEREGPADYAEHGLPRAYGWNWTWPRSSQNRILPGEQVRIAEKLIQLPGRRSSRSSLIRCCQARHGNRGCSSQRDDAYCGVMSSKAILDHVNNNGCGDRRWWPAGAAIALALARRGLSPIVIEAQSTPKMKVGECLPPDINPLLNDFGLTERLFAKRKSPFARKPICLGIGLHSGTRLYLRVSRDRMAIGPSQL